MQGCELDILRGSVSRVDETLGLLDSSLAGGDVEAIREALVRVAGAVYELDVAGKIAKVLLGRILWHVKQRWEKIPQAVRGDLLDFQGWVESWCHVEYQTVRRYMRIWRAWFSGEFEYELSEGRHPFQLSLACLDFGGSLILAGEFNSNPAIEDILFGEGDGGAKRDAIRALDDDLSVRPGNCTKGFNLITESGL